MPATFLMPIIVGLLTSMTFFYAQAEIENQTQCYGSLFNIACSESSDKIIYVSDAYYGYSRCNIPADNYGCCPDITVDCLISIPDNKPSYYETIKTTCDNKHQCYLPADWFVSVDCGAVALSDYVIILYYCLLPGETIAPMLETTSASTDLSEPLITGSTIATTTFSSADNAIDHSSNGKNSSGAIIGIVVGCVAALVTIIVIVVLIIIIRRKKLSPNKPEAYCKPVHDLVSDDIGDNKQYACLESDDRTYYNDPKSLRRPDFDGDGDISSTGNALDKKNNIPCYAEVKFQSAKGENSKTADADQGNHLTDVSQSDNSYDEGAEVVVVKENNSSLSPSQQNNIYYNDHQALKTTGNSKTSGNEYDGAAVVKMKGDADRSNQLILSDDNVILVENTLYG